MRSRIGLVLSGGSVRAAAQIGVLKALEEYCLEPEVVVGTSGGAIVAALYAGGLSARQLEELFFSLQQFQRGDRRSQLERGHFSSSHLGCETFERCCAGRWPRENYRPEPAGKQL